MYFRVLYRKSYSNKDTRLIVFRVCDWKGRVDASVFKVWVSLENCSQDFYFWKQMCSSEAKFAKTLRISHLPKKPEELVHISTTVSRVLFQADEFLLSI